MSLVRTFGASIAASALAGLVSVSPVAAQTFDRPLELSGEVATLRLSEFKITSVGTAVNVAWHVAPALAVDGALIWFPGGWQSGTGTLASQERLLGLLGVNTGLPLGPVELRWRARAGFLNFGDEGPIACPAIFPPTLECQLAPGYMAFATDLGGGVNIRLDYAGRTRLRVDAGDLLVRYGVNALRPRGQITDGFVSHNLLMSAGLGLRF